MFKPPTDLASYLPPANAVRISSVVPSTGGPLTDEYKVVPVDSPPSPERNMFFPHGTSLTLVNKLCPGDVAFDKFKRDTLSLSDQSNPFQLQLAGMWFMNNIGRPYYGL